MPIYMDRHDVSESVTAEIIAELHQKDLKVQSQFGCRGLTYWFDDQRKTAFCLIEAPNMEAIREMHDYAHGQVPHRVIEVDTSIVESFLGRIGDPVKAQNVELNIINDPAFRAIMVVELKAADLGALKAVVERFAEQVPEVVAGFEGTIVKRSAERVLISFQRVSNAVHGGLELRRIWGDVGGGGCPVQMGVSCGVPVTEKNLIFEDAVRLAERMVMLGVGNIVVSTEVRELYESENPVLLAGREGVCCLSAADEEFVMRLMDHAEKSWGDVDLKVDDLNKEMGFSKAQLYRKMVGLTGRSPNAFIADYRLDAALSLLKKGSGNVSQIAYETGFSSPSYFAKCFQKRFGMSPTDYLAMMKNYQSLIQ